MKEEDVKEGDIVEIDYIGEFTKEHVNEGKALVLWKGNNNQPLVHRLNTKTTTWTCYEHIGKIIDHVDIKGYMDNALRSADIYEFKHLNEEDRTMLGRSGYSQDAIEKLDRTIGRTDYRLFEKDADIIAKKGRKISAKKARSLLGTEEFLSGIFRTSTFYQCDTRYLPDGRKIYFDDSSANQVE